MKKLIIIIIFSFLTSLVCGQDITGNWSGDLSIQGTKLKLVFDIQKNVNKYKATMDSPDQGAFGIPVSSIQLRDSILSIIVDKIKIAYEGVFRNDTIKGNFKQLGMELPLNLSRQEEQYSIALKRPQEPKEPYPYKIKDIVFKNYKDDIKLSGTLTTPLSVDDKLSTIILISGSGPQNRDSEIFGHKPFLVLADYLTKQGFAVLRFDDRGIGKSKGDFKTATTVDFRNDVEAAINFLNTVPEINTEKIGLIGHSEGGIVASMVASNSKKIAFVVLLSSPGIRGDQVLLKQQEEIARSNNIDEKTIKNTKEGNIKMYQIIQDIDNLEFLRKKLKTYLAQNILPLDVNENNEIDEALDIQVEQMTTPWFKNFISYDPKDAIQKLKAPLLVINGDKDIQVNAKVNLSAIEKSLKAAENKNFTIIEAPGLNHLFQECKTCKIDEYSKIEQTFSPQIMETISSWILSIVK